MRYLIIGAGRMAAGAVHDLLALDSTSAVCVSDWQKQALDRLAIRFSDKRLETFVADARSKEQMQELMNRADGVLSAASYELNYDLSQWAIEAHCHFVDLGGNYPMVEKQFGLDLKAKTAGVGIIPDCGLAPGMVSVVAAQAVRDMNEVASLEIRVGGLPVKPQTPLNYMLIFSVRGLTNEYLEQAVILEDKQIRKVPSMTGIESLTFPAPFTELEAFYTSGGTSTLPATYQGKIKNLDYKTIRYPGHCRLFKAMIDLGFMQETNIDIGGRPLSRREVFEQLLKEVLTVEGEDVTLIRITARGLQDGRDIQKVYQAVEYGDKENELTAMMRTTAFPAIIALQMLVDGRIRDRGVLRQEVSIPGDIFLKELEKRNIRFTVESGPMPDIL